MNPQIQILFINNDGAGFAERINVDRGTTVAQVVNQYGNGDPSSYTIRVNRLEATRDQVLNDNDRVSITPAKVSAA